MFYAYVKATLVAPHISLSAIAKNLVLIKCDEPDAPAVRHVKLETQRK